MSTAKNDKPQNKNRLKLASIFLAYLAFAMMLGSFFTPPIGKLDNSVLAGIGEFIGIISIFFAWDAVESGRSAKVNIGKTSVVISKKTKKQDGTATKKNS